MGKEELNTDYYLWKSFKEGNSDSFYQLYDQYADILYRYGMNFSKDKESIKDCIHDLFLDLYKYRVKLATIDNIRFYLLRSLRRKIHLNQIKSNPIIYINNSIPSNDNHELPFENSIIASEIELENNIALTKALKKLNDRQREGLSLKFEYNLSYSEIAEILNMSVESARTAIYRALKILRKSMQNDQSSIQLLLLLTRSVFI